jgi:hypothetical protein
MDALLNKATTKDDNPAPVRCPAATAPELPLFMLQQPPAAALLLRP